MIGLLVIGLLCNEFIRPVDPAFHELASEQVAREVVTAA
jgi:hypothetical protein